jgi:molybdenum cofactor synthesis domain-containing protein
VTIDVPVKHAANVRARGEDIMPGARVLAAGTVVGPADVGVLASVGRATVSVVRRPRVAIVSAGAELVEIDETPGPAQVVNSNAWVLAAAVAQAGGLPIVRDRFEDIRRRVEEAADADVILSTGGVSVGEYDFVRDAAARRFWKVAQKPGKPLTFGTLGPRLFFGLPGNPVSAPREPGTSGARGGLAAEIEALRELPRLVVPTGLRPGVEAAQVLKASCRYAPRGTPNEGENREGAPGANPDAENGEGVRVGHEENRGNPHMGRSRFRFSGGEEPIRRGGLTEAGRARKLLAVAADGLALP